jgi:uncharacterized repeat protein (TIGR03847 family)
MASEQVDLGPVQQLVARALGPPGRRTFRLVAASRMGTAWLWLEKEELQVLGMTIEQLLGQLPLDPALVAATISREEAAGPDVPEERPAVEFRVGRLSMGYEERSDLFVLMAHADDADPDGPPTFRCEASRRQLRALARQIAAICAAGRPRCPLCGVPLETPKHPCPRLN